MEEIQLKNWDALESYLLERIPVGPRPPIFRGHANAAWTLTTTLERYLDRVVSMKEYYFAIFTAAFEIQTLTERAWKLPSPTEYWDWLEKRPAADGFPGNEYMIYMRHHEFPSPLLDWSRSPYVAAFFAFSNPSFGAEEVAIYVFQEAPRGTKTWNASSPHIERRGQYATSHARHFRQQCEYTICTRRSDEKEWFYAKHDDVFSEGRDDQDVLVKLILPASERSRVLSHLDKYNLNAFTLFGSEESLMQTTAFRLLK